MFGKKKKKEEDLGKMPDFSEQMGPGTAPPGLEGPQTTDMPPPPPGVNISDDKMNMPQPDMTPSFKEPPKKSPSPTKEEVEEISEAIFSEKTEEFVKKLDELKSWQKKVVSKLDLQEKEIGYLRGGLSGFRDDINMRLVDCQKGIKEVNVEIKVMEKIFSEIMPAFVENLKELSEVVDKLKGFTSVKKTEGKDNKKSK